MCILLVEVVFDSIWSVVGSGAVRYFVVNVGGAIWWVRNKLKEEENVKEVNYQIKTKH